MEHQEEPKEKPFKKNTIGKKKRLHQVETAIGYCLSVLCLTGKSMAWMVLEATEGVNMICCNKWT